ncbi:MAG: hypothetical protein SO314_01565 [Alphaproteobacteria bacterium]|nr:hypothetical protein [Alphaproteobacteria bacterium]
MANIILLLVTALAVLIVVIKVKNVRLSHIESLLSEEKQKREALEHQNSRLNNKLKQMKQQQPFMSVSKIGKCNFGT